MAAWSRSKLPTAPLKTQALLNEMISSSQNHGTKPRPAGAFFELVLKTCADAEVDPHLNVPLTVAVQTFGRMRLGEAQYVRWPCHGRPALDQALGEHPEGEHA